MEFDYSCHDHRLFVTAVVFWANVCLKATWYGPEMFLRDWLALRLRFYRDRRSYHTTQLQIGPLLLSGHRTDWRA